MTKTNRQTAIFFSIAAAVVLSAFIAWAVQMESKIVRYENDNSSALDAATRSGWRVTDTSMERQVGEYTAIGSTAIRESDVIVTVVTLERSNWSKLLND